jgi:hypothetical protein
MTRTAQFSSNLRSLILLCLAWVSPAVVHAASGCLDSDPMPTAAPTGSQRASVTGDTSLYGNGSALVTVEVWRQPCPPAESRIFVRLSTGQGNYQLITGISPWFYLVQGGRTYQIALMPGLGLIGLGGISVYLPNQSATGLMIEFPNEPHFDRDGAFTLYFQPYYGTTVQMLHQVSLPARSGGTNPSQPVPETVIEYYNSTLDHYFITWAPTEIANLDSGKTIGWARTGQSFNVYAAGASPVCRFYIPPGLGDSHFFGRGTAECNSTGQKNPSFVLESSDFMQMVLPAGGVCPTGTRKVYRVFSNRPDANHRYMTDRAIRDQMVANGWIAEGDGPDLVVMCARP